jgi:transposase
MVLGYSRMLYAEVVADETQATFLSCHEHAFGFFGGMTEDILYDNAKVVALQHNHDGVLFNPALLDFAGRCGFEPKVCHPYRPQTKGKVERSVRYIRDSFLEGERFASLDDMGNKLAAWLDNVANARVHATTGRRPIDMLLEERLLDCRPLEHAEQRPFQPHVMRLATRDFDIAKSPAVEDRPLSAYEAACG